MTDPIEVFLSARNQARIAGAAMDGTIAVLATSTPEGRPSARFVLVKEVEAEGFFFYTNYQSRKASELDQNPFAALAIHWPETGVQFRIEGPVERAASDRSDAYFGQRPRESRLGAWASPQSQPITSRGELEARLAEVTALYPAEVPRPPHWGGFRLIPKRIEHWINGEYRLHDRHLYERLESGWKVTLLAP